jgi:hypothetical protein
MRLRWQCGVLSVNSISGNSVTDRQMVPQSRDRPRNNLGSHLTATREEPEAPSSGSRMDYSNRQGEAPAHMESGAPPTGRTESSQYQGAGLTLNVFGAPSMDPSGQPVEAPPTQSELGAPSALGKPQAAPPDPEEIGNSSHYQRLAWIENEFSL